MKQVFTCAWRGPILTVALALSLTLAGPAAANPYADGLDAALDGDYQTAAAHWGRLATINDGHAQFQLALMYHAGLHVGQDEEMAVRLYLVAAENGVQEAQEYLAAGYQHGWFGLPRNRERAAYWISRFDHPPAQQVAQR